MRTYIPMCPYIPKHIYVYIYIYTHICTYTQIYIHIHIHPHIPIYIHVYPYIHTQRHIYTYTHTYASMHAYLYVYLCPSLGLHTRPCTHPCAYLCAPVVLSLHLLPVSVGMGLWVCFKSSMYPCRYTSLSPCASGVRSVYLTVCLSVSVFVFDHSIPDGGVGGSVCFPNPFPVRLSRSLLGS